MIKLIEKNELIMGLLNKITYNRRNMNYKIVLVKYITIINT